jgi:hypothetical protein
MAVSGFFFYQLLYLRAKCHFRGHGLRVLGLQMRVHFQEQLTIITMPDPFGQREYVNTGLQTLRNKIVPHIVMGKPFAIRHFASAIQTPLAL